MSTKGQLNDSTFFAVAIVMIVFTPITILATGLRFVSSRITLKRVGPEDWLALAALLCYLVWVVLGLISISTIHGLTPGHSSEVIPLETIKTSLKLNYAVFFFFMPNQLFAKGSILLFYHRIFGVNRAYRRCIYALATAQFCLTIANILGDALQCTPVHKYWDIDLMEGHCINLSAYLAGSETVNSLIDFAMVTLALVMLRELRTSWQTKWRLSLIFMIGGLAGVIGFLKFGLAFHSTVSSVAMLGLWATIQMACSILCCCAITYKPLLGHTGFFSRLASKLSTYGSRVGLGLRTPSGRAIDESGQSSNSARSGGWIDLEGAGRRKGQVATSISATPNYDGTERDFTRQTKDSERPAYQMKSIQIHRTVEDV